MDPERVEDILSRYGSTLPDDPLLPESVDRRLRAELRASVQSESEERSSSTKVIHRFRRREKIHLGVIAGLTAVAAILVFMLVRPGFVEEPAPDPLQLVAELVADGERTLRAGDYLTAEALYRDALGRILEIEGPPRVDRAVILERLGDALEAQGRDDETALLYEQALALRLEDFPESYLDVARIGSHLAERAARLGDLEGARDLFEQQAELFGTRRGHRDESNRSFFDEVVAMSSARQADLTRRLAERGSSAEHYQRYVDGQLALPTPGEATRPMQLGNLTHAYRRLGELALLAGDLRSADEYFSQALTASEALYELDPENEESIEVLTLVLQPLADVARQRFDLASCRGYLDRSFELQTRLLERDPKDLARRREIGEILANRGDAALQQGELEAARADFTEYAKICDALVDNDRRNVTYRENQALAHAQLARVAELSGEDREALRQHRDVLAITKRLADDHPGNPRHRENAATSHMKIAAILEDAGKLDDVAAEVESSVLIYEGLSTDEPRNKRFLEHLSIGYSRLSDLKLEIGDRDAAARYARLALRTDQWLARHDPENPIYRDILLASFERAADLSYVDGSAATAADYYEELASMREELFGKNDPLTARARARHAASIAANERTARNDLSAAAATLTECVRIFRALGQGHEWTLEALEALALLYSPERLDYPRRLRDVQQKLDGLR